MAIKEDIIKSFGDNVVLTGNSIVDKKVLTIPVSPALDIILNGGIPEGSFVILTGQPKSGKAQRLTDIVYTPYGPKTIGSIKVGDKVSNHNGTVSSVVGVYPQGKKDIYQVKFNDGSYTYCGLDHNWTVAKNNGYENYTTLTLEQILNEGLRQKDRYKWRIPTAKPVFFKQKKRLNLKPYILGSILDSGSINGGDLILTTNNKSILNTFKNFYDHHYKELKIKRIDRYDYIVKEKQSSGLLTYNNLLQSLRALRLTHNGQIVPFIPSSYKYSSLKNRQQLIRGIFDSGAINNSGRIARYNSTNERLILDIREVLESLGYFCKIYKENIETTINYETKQYLVFKLTVQGKDINELFSISSKKNPIKHKAEIFRTITDITKVGHEEAVCIEVDNSDGLYLTNNFIVTHNTTTSLDFAATAQKTEYAHGSFKDGRQVYYLNIEGRLKKRDLEGIPGLDLNRFHVIGSQQGKILHAEEYLQIAEKIINEVPGSVLIIDSYSALCTEAEITSDMDKMQRADGAKLLAKFCRKVANVIPVNQNVVIGITHLMGNPTGYGAEFKEKSGQAIAYQTDVKLRVKSFKPWTLSADNTQIGQEVEWQVICSALGPPGGVITSYIRYGSGVDKHMEAISLASDLGLIQKGGAWYTLISSKDKPKFQGTEKVRAYLLENPKEYDELVNNIKQTMGIKCS